MKNVALLVVTVHDVPACPRWNQSSHLSLPLLGFPAQMWDQMLYFFHYSMLSETLVAVGTWPLQFFRLRLRVRDDNDSKHRGLSATRHAYTAGTSTRLTLCGRSSHKTNERQYGISLGHVHGICHFMIREHCL